MDQPQIRMATIEDAQRVVALLHLSELEDAAAKTATELAVHACIDEAGSDIYVAEVEGELIGYLAVHWVPFPMLRGREAYISDLQIAPEWRGRGVGGQLLLAAETRARELQCVRLMLNNRISAESFERGFYRKAGFRHRTDFANFVRPL